MIWVVLLLLGVMLALLQKKWAPTSLRKLRIHGECSQILAQPGEKVTWRVKVENHSRLPVMFVRLQMHFPNSAEFDPACKWVQENCFETIRQRHVEQKFYLGARKSKARQIDFSLPDRGEYTVGSYRLSTGDLLGFQEAHVDGDGGTVVVMPRCARNHRTLLALGGFLGDITVRRFILEDPILTAGFRDYSGREPMKSISWTRTAITGKLQVKQFDHTAEQTVVVLLNVEGGTPEQLEGCFRQLRTVCQELERKKIPYGLRTNGDLPGPVSKLFFLAEGLGSSHMNTILYALGRASYACFHSFRYLTEQTLLHRKNNESYILVTPSGKLQEWQYITRLENAVGNALCVLTGQEEVEST